MRHRFGFTIFSGHAALAAMLAVAGCAGSPNPAAGPQTSDQAGEASPSAGAAADAQAYADRLAAAMRPQQPAAAPPPDIRWLEPGADVPANPQAKAQPAPADGRAPAARVTNSAAESADPAVPTPQADDAPPAPAPRDDLVRSLLARIESSDRPALARAIDAATLSVVGSGRPLAPRLLEPLDFEQRGLVQRYHQVLSLLVTQLADGEAELDRKALDARLDELFGQQPVAIRGIELCSRVTGYGIYEPFEKATFLSGRDQKMIVYVELDHFQTVEETPGRFEVELEQEIALFNESDGLAVWRSDPVSIVDASRNRRHDFFVVQLITLPARLSVGKYRLKVRITDLHGGSLDERTVPLEIVADESMVQRD